MAMDWNREFISLRDRYIEGCFGRLNDVQKQAVFSTEGPLLILAGAGSGKTTVLVNRVANIIRFGTAHGSDWLPREATEQDVEELRAAVEGGELPDRLWYMMRHDNVRPWNVLAITFTNKAAGELKARLGQMLGEEEGADVNASTFHSACVRMLRRDADRLGFPKSFTIYDTDDQQRAMKEVYKKLLVDDKFLPIKTALGNIGRMKDKLISPEDALAARADTKEGLIAQVYKAYADRLKSAGAMDFDDLIYYTVCLLQDFPEVREYYQSKYHYVLVDEYQDTSVAQFELVRLLGGGYRNVCVVGDDDQSIYRFRGATIENILNFENQYKGARTIRLEQNYRSTQAIPNAANAVISHNTNRKGKKLWTSNDDGEKVTVFEAFNEGEEANYVAGRIIAMSRGKNFKDYAVLYRTNAQSNAMEYAFKRNGVPYRIIGGTRFFDRAEVKDMLAYLWLINNRADDLRMARIVNTPPRGIGSKTIETAQRLAQAEGVSLYHVVSHPNDYAALEKPAPKLKAFSDLIESLAELLTSGISLADFYEEMIHRVGYVEMLQAKPTEENKTRLENVRELKSSISNYMENAECPTLAGFLEEIALYTDIEQYDADADACVMMTIHSAKGLEFDHVFLVGFEDGLFPGMRSIGDEEEMEEERRLCYVAITRAKKTLDITHARQRMLYGRTTGAKASRFLDEIPEEFIEKKGGMKRPEPAQRSGGYGGYGSYGGGYGGKPRMSAAARMHKEKIQRSEKSVFTAAPEKVPMLEVNQGDMVQHEAFGKGMVLSVMNMGGDALLEIAFDEIGTKRLMAKAASAHMKKL